MVFKVHKASEKLTQKQKNPELTLKGVVDSLAKAGLDTTLFFSIQVLSVIKYWILPSWLAFSFDTNINLNWSKHNYLTFQTF